MPSFEQCYAAAVAKDARFDGWIFCGVTSTGIYCRPSCPARTPKPKNIRFLPSAAAAQSAGFRACKRCRPDATPGSPEWDLRADLVGRAMRLIADGVVDREGVTGLAARLGYAERHVHRQMTAVVGAGPLAIARSGRGQTARILIETTALPFADVAFAAGFTSVRQFNDTIREIFATTPSELRKRARPAATDAPKSVVTLRLPHRRPFDAAGLLAFLGHRAIAGVEEFDDQGVYRRSMRLPQGQAVVEFLASEDDLHARFHLGDLRDLGAAVGRTRMLCDLDSDPVAVDAVLGADSILAPLVDLSPGRRVPGTVDGAELAFRAVLGQQVSVGGARTAASRLTATHGEALERPTGGVTHLFPTAATIAEIDPATQKMPQARARALIGLAGVIAAGELVLDGAADRQEARQKLLSVPGIGPWTVAYVAMRALRDPDAFLPTDIGVRNALTALGADGSPAAAAKLAQRWSPYRSYALQHLWASLGAPVVNPLEKVAA
ncbi:MAG: AlkA N-terminal domain-containing protein [Solirubrobacterales bacterium]